MGTKGMYGKTDIIVILWSLGNTIEHVERILHPRNIKAEVRMKLSILLPPRINKSIERAFLSQLSPFRRCFNSDE